MTSPVSGARADAATGTGPRAGATAVGAGEAAERRTGRVAVVGETVRVEGYTLAGAVVAAADTPGEVRAAWQALPADVVLAVLTPAAAQALEGLADPADRRPGPGAPGRLSVVMPT